MPRNDLPRIARGNERYTIPPYETYVAIPMAANPAPEPDLILSLPIGHPQVFDPSKPRRTKAPLEKVTKVWRRNELVAEPKKIPFAIYMATGYEIILKAFAKNGKPLDYDNTPIHPATDLKPGQTSLQWLSPLTKIGSDGVEKDIDREKLRTTGAPPPAAAAFADLLSGHLRPSGLVPSHSWRFLQARNTVPRAIATEVVASTSVEGGTSQITLRSLENQSEDRIITFEANGPTVVIVGCEPLDDILGTASVQSCAEPLYDYELHYLLLGDEVPPPAMRGVPVCSAGNDDHRSPPGALCGPPAVFPKNGG
ncbi:MAG TPA: hypothetical protein VKB93_23460 [Thermoanaerobaculia bacterium]|nr:hypothetical protein [Thermoanaerobaculia bacterium]